MTDIVDSNEAFMVIEPKQQDCMVGMENTLDQTLAYWQQMIENSGPAGENYIYCISADSAFPVLDYVAQEKTYYDKFEPWIMPLLILTGVGFILALIGLVILTIAAGKTNKDQEVHLNFFDRWYTEIAAGAVIGIWLAGTIILGTLIANSSLGYSYAVVTVIVTCLICGTYTMAWFLIGYLSLVRRIKAGTLWKNSLIRKVLKWIGKCSGKLADFVRAFSRNTAEKIKVLLVGGAFLFLQFLIIGCIFGGAEVFLLALMAVDVAAMIFASEKRTDWILLWMV